MQKDASLYPVSLRVHTHTHTRSNPGFHPLLISPIKGGIIQDGGFGGQATVNESRIRMSAYITDVLLCDWFLQFLKALIGKSYLFLEVY